MIKFEKSYVQITCFLLLLILWRSFRKHFTDVCMEHIRHLCSNLIRSAAYVKKVLKYLCLFLSQQCSIIPYVLEQTTRWSHVQDCNRFRIMIILVCYDFRAKHGTTTDDIRRPQKKKCTTKYIKNLFLPSLYTVCSSTTSNVSISFEVMCFFS